MRLSLTSNFYTPVEIKKEKKGRMDNESMISDVNALFGITDDGDAGAEAPPTETPAEEQDDQTGENSGSEGTETAAPPTETPAPETTPNPETPAEDTPLNPEEKFTKQGRAFAQMRIQNKEYSDLIMSLAKATGQNPKNITEAQDMLKEGLNKVVSKNRNIPEDVLREMEEDKRALAEFKQQQARQKALAGFQSVKDTFGLSREDVNGFADKLIENKLNPFEQDIDLVKEYRNLYFDQLIAKAREEGVQQERARSLKAQQNSTTPSTQKGIADNTGNQGNPIKTIADLDKLLDSLK